MSTSKNFFQKKQQKTVLSHATCTLEISMKKNLTLSKVKFQNILPQNKEKKRRQQFNVSNVSTRTLRKQLSANKNNLEDEDDLKVMTVSLDDFFKENMIDIDDVLNSDGTVQNNDKKSERGTKDSTEKTLGRFGRLLLKNVSEQNVQMCFTEVLKCIFSPITSQLAKNNVQLTENDENLCLRLFQCARSAFPDLSAKAEKIWEDLAIDSFPPLVNRLTKEPLQIDAVDYGLQDLYIRREMVEKGKEYFSEQNFSTKSSYDKWREQELQIIDSLIKTAKSTRESHPFLLKLAINVMTASIQCSGKKTTNTFICKIQLSSKSKHLMQIKANQVVLNQEMKRYEISFNSQVLSLDLMSKEQDLFFHLFKKGVMKMRKYGEFRLSLSHLLNLFQPGHCSWGTHVFESYFDVMKYSQKADANIQKKIGTIQIRFVMQMEMHPRIKSLPITVNTEKAPNYHILFDILVEKIIATKQMKSRKDFKLLTFYQDWILQEFCNHHGISELYKRLSLMRQMVAKTDIILCGIDEFRQNFDFVVSSIKAKTVIPSRKEVDLLRIIKAELIKRIEFILTQFIILLEGERRYVLKILVELLEYLQTRDDLERESMTKEEFADYIRKLIQKAIEQDYDKIRQEQIDVDDNNTKDITAPSLIRIIQFLNLRIDDILYYSIAFPDYINFSVSSIGFYYDKFDTDFDRVQKLTGFTGYQMLFFSHKLREYHDQIYECFDEKTLKKHKIRLMDVENISRGYDEKYIFELKNRLIKHIQRSVDLETWKHGNDVLHSQSLIDLFTSANQTVSFMMELEFLTDSLLDKYTIAVGECVIKYAQILQDLCIKEVTSKQEEAIEKATKKGRRKSILDVQSLFFAPVKEEKENESTLSINSQFIVKINNIEASKLQYDHMVQYIKEEKISTDVNEEKSQDEDTSKEEETDTDSSIDENSGTEEEDIERKKNDMVKSYLPKLYDSLDIISDDLILLLIAEFDEQIKSGLMRIMQQVKKDIKKSDKELLDDELIELYGKSTTKLLKKTFLDTVLTPNLSTLSENIYDKAFSKILVRLYGVFLRECTNLMMPESPTVMEMGDYLDRTQVILLQHLVSYASEYFYGNGEGLSRETIKKERRFINTVFKMFNMPTVRLINMYKKLEGSTSTLTAVKGHHVLSILHARKKLDKEAAKFLKEVYSNHIETFLLHDFGLNKQGINRKNQSAILFSHYCRNDKLKKGTCYLIYDYILWSPSYIFTKKSDAKFIKENTSVDRYNGKIKIYLKDVIEMRPLNPFIGKGIKFYFDNGKPSIKLYLDTRNIRDSFMSTIQEEASQKQLNIRLLEPRAKGSKERPKALRASKVVLDTSTINPALVAPKDVAKTLQSRFGINATLVERYMCRCAVNDQDEEGTLYLFDNCFLFDALGNYSIDASDLLASWYRVDQIVYNSKDLQIEMVLNDSRRVIMHDFLSNFAEVTQCVKDLIQTFRKDNNKLLELKHSDIRTYYLARFKIKNDVLLESVSCSIPGTGWFSIYGMLYIGSKFLCFEKDGSPDVISIPIDSIQSITVKSWQFWSNTCLDVAYGKEQQQIQKFIIKSGMEKIFDLIMKQWTESKQK